jgi:hypothetical protein
MDPGSKGGIEIAEEDTIVEKGWSGRTRGGNGRMSSRSRGRLTHSKQR